MVKLTAQSFLRILVFVFTIFSIFRFQPPSTVFAAITGASEHVYCNGIVETGTSSDPYVGLEFYYRSGPSFILIQNSDAGTPGFVFFPVTGGAYSFTYMFPALPEGTPINGEVYGSSGVAAFANWDGGPFFPPGYVPCSGLLATRTDDTVCVNLDNRVNSICGDAAQTAAIYCNKDGGLTIYGIWIDGSSFIAYTLTKAELDVVPADPAPKVNTLIKQGKGVRLYRLTNGKLQVNAATKDPGKEYVFIFNECQAPMK